MKILKIKKTYKNIWHDLPVPDCGFFRKEEKRNYIVELSEEELMKYYVERAKQMDAKNLKMQELDK